MFILSVVPRRKTEKFKDTLRFTHLRSGETRKVADINKRIVGPHTETFLMQPTLLEDKVALSPPDAQTH